LRQTCEAENSALRVRSMALELDVLTGPGDAPGYSIL